MTNEGQLDMMKNMLQSALDHGFDMSLFHCYILNDNKNVATYNTREFRTITTRKLEVILENMKLDNEVLWIDNDIVLFNNCIEDVRNYKGKFVMQDDIWSPCTGFFLVRSDLFSMKAIQECINILNTQQPNQVMNDQHVFNSVYRRTIGLTVSLLPREEYPNGEIYFNQKKTSKAKMVHCNYILTTAEKVQRLKDHKLWNVSNQAFDMVKKYYI
jgi:hypothetical protein